MKLLIVSGTESAFSFSGSYEWYRPTSSHCSTQPKHAHEHHTTPLQRTHTHAHTHKFDATTHACRSSVSRSRAVCFVLQVPWHKPSSQEANHIKSMSHVAAYTGSEALRGVMLDIVLHPHTVTQIPQPQLFFFGLFGLKISAYNNRAHLKFKYTMHIFRSGVFPFLISEIITPSGDWHSMA